VSIVIFVAIVANIVLFAGLGIWGWRYRSSEQSPRIRLLSDMLVLVAVAFVLGAVTRLVSVAVRFGWLDGRVSDFVVSEWHLVQSLGATGLGIFGFFYVRRHARSLRTADRIASVVSERLLQGSTLTGFGFTSREVEVLRAIAEGHVSDADIAAILFNAPATAATHVRNILKKTGMRSRRELALMVASSNL
jgi:DNA-binding CsgD family transcriptional regulator